MLVLTFWLGKDRYALRSTSVRRVVPLPELKTLPKSPPYVAGVFNYRGKTAPVIDLSVIMNDIPCRRLMSTRIIMINYDDGHGGTHVMGLMAERVMETIKIADEELDSPGVTPESSPYLDQIAHKADGMIQLVDTDKLLPNEVRAILFHKDPHGTTEQKGKAR